MKGHISISGIVMQRMGLFLNAVQNPVRPLLASLQFRRHDDMAQASLLPRDVIHGGVPARRNPADIRKYNFLVQHSVQNAR